MTALREAAQQVLEAITEHLSGGDYDYPFQALRQSAVALRAALEAPEAGPVKLVPTELTDEMMAVYQTAFVSQDRFDVHKVWDKMLDAAPKVEPLTDAKIIDAFNEYAGETNPQIDPFLIGFARVVEKRVRGE